MVIVNLVKLATRNGQGRAPACGAHPGWNRGRLNQHNACVGVIQRLLKLQIIRVYGRGVAMPHEAGDLRRPQ